MSGSVNKVVLVGHVGKDPEFRAIQDGSELATFSVATSERWKDKTTGEQKEKTEWHRIVVFSSNLVSVVKQYVKRGTNLYIEGALQTRKYQDKAGIDRYSTEIVLKQYNSSMVLLGSKSDMPLPRMDIGQDEDSDDNDSSMPF